jgi:hypothetical protein
MPIQFKVTKEVLIFCASWILMGAVVQSSPMTAGGVVALLVMAPVALVHDWIEHRKAVYRLYRLARPLPLLLTPPD